MTSTVEVAGLKLEGKECVESAPVQSQSATKLSIIDQELNRHGMGHYQWFIWVICGTGHCLNIMWTQATVFSLANIQHEFGFSDKELGNMSASLVAGTTAGAFMWGILADVVGRRIAFLGTCLIAGVFGMCASAMSSYNGLIVILACIGIGIGGSIPIDSTITIEYLPEDRRFLLTALSIFQSFAVVVTILIALGLIPSYSCPKSFASCRITDGVQPCCSRDGNMGWRYTFFTVASITLALFVVRFFIFPFYESPKYLLSRGKDRDAVEVVRKIAAFNGDSSDLTVESLYSQSKETPSLLVGRTRFPRRCLSEVFGVRILFGSWKMARVTTLVWLFWIFDCWGLSIATSYLPLISQRKNSATNVSLRQTYVDYLSIYSPGVVATVLSVLMVRTPMVGQKWTLVFSSMLMGVSLFLYGQVNTEASHVGLNMLRYFCQCLFNAALVGWMPEAFPVAVRGTATGLASFFGNLMSVSGPLLAAQLFGSTHGSTSVLYLAGSGIFVCTICILVLPTKDMVAPG